MKHYISDGIHIYVLNLNIPHFCFSIDFFILSLQFRYIYIFIIMIIIIIIIICFLDTQVSLASMSPHKASR